MTDTALINAITTEQAVKRLTTRDLMEFSGNHLVGKMRPDLQAAARAEIQHRLAATGRKQIVTWSHREEESGLTYCHTLGENGEFVTTHGITPQRLDIEYRKAII